VPAGEDPIALSTPAEHQTAGPLETMPTREDAVELADVRRAARAGEGIVRCTPVLSRHTLSERAGGAVVLKAENMQRTGSFKLRGALAKIASLGERCERGVIAGSAGNHAQALAYAARARGVPCEVFMPVGAAVGKVEAAAALGAVVHLQGSSVDEALAAARERAQATGATLVHPFDDPVVVAGQGGVGLELVEQIPDLARVIVPVGGGGLASGVAVAVKSQRPRVEVIGVQAQACAPFAQSLAAGRPLAVQAAQTIADGIAVKRPGELTLALISRWVDELVTVAEDDVAEAMVFLLERAKLVVEGAGAVGVAALLSGAAHAAPTGTTAVVLSGGNVDAGLLAEVARRHETQAGRRLVLAATISDSPGQLAALLSLVAANGANLLDVQHIREGVDLHVRETAVQLVLQTRGPAHAAAVNEAIRAAGYPEPRLLR
jgi:threonine dehydratase